MKIVSGTFCIDLDKVVYVDRFEGKVTVHCIGPYHVVLRNEFADPFWKFYTNGAKSLRDLDSENVTDSELAQEQPDAPERE